MHTRWWKGERIQRVRDMDNAVENRSNEKQGTFINYFLLLLNMHILMGCCRGIHLDLRSVTVQSLSNFSPWVKKALISPSAAAAAEMLRRLHFMNYICVRL
jgi:hypothetical protein